MSSMETVNDISELRVQLLAAAEKKLSIEEQISRVKDAIQQVDSSFCGSWLGYHSRIYYRDFTPTPPGAHFSQEWGMMNGVSGRYSRGNWVEYSREDVKAKISSLAGNPDLGEIRSVGGLIESEFLRIRDEALAILHAEAERDPTPYVKTIIEKLSEYHLADETEVLNSVEGGGQIMTRDTTALGQGKQAPPHFSVWAGVFRTEHAAEISIKASRDLLSACSFIERRHRNLVRGERVGTNVFIGHGRSVAWRDLKDFLSERLGLPWDEFNRVPIAGVTNIGRLEEMLGDAAIAFIVMTAEDEVADGKTQARMNVIHEAGLFQGRLGFTKAIVLLEDGCEEFSNIQGLGQIRFPKGNIAAAFEEIRRVLEREGLVAV